MKNKQLTTTNEEVNQLVEGLTPKQAKFLILWLKTGNGTKAAMEVCETDDPNVAAVYASTTLRKIKNPMKLYLETRGIGINKLAKVLEDALVAEKTDITGDKHPDHRVRLEASDRLSRWLDVEPKQAPTVAVQVNNQIKADDFFE